MSWFGKTVFAAMALTACAGLPKPAQPLFIARPADSTLQRAGDPSVVTDLNNVLLTLPASTVTGCAGLAGDYRRNGKDVRVQLRQEPASECPDQTRPFITRIGPLPPGSYEITVMLDGSPLIRAARATIS